MWLKDVFGTDKPVIGMVHLHAMPTDPKYDAEGGIEKIVQKAKDDILALQEGGVDGLLFCNEFAIPYTSNIRTVTVATYARVIGELKSIMTLPFGITFCSSAYNTLDIAMATGAQFVRCVYHGASAGVYGLSSSDPGDVERHRHYIGAKDIKTLTAIISEGDEQIAPRPIKQVAKTLAFNLNPDTILVYSDTPGSSIDVEQVRTIKEVTDTPVFASNGVKPETIEEILSVCDGAIVATSTKYDGKFFNQGDVERVKKLMVNAKAARGDMKDFIKKKAYIRKISIRFYN